MTHRSDNHHSCPDLETWTGYVDQSLGADRMQTLKAHLQGCTYCFSRVSSLMLALGRGEEARSEPQILDEEGGRTLIPASSDTARVERRIYSKAPEADQDDALAIPDLNPDLPSESTPSDLLSQAQNIPLPLRRQRRWLLYSAAAALLLAVVSSLYVGQQLPSELEVAQLEVAQLEVAQLEVAQLEVAQFEEDVPPMPPQSAPPAIDGIANTSASSDIDIEPDTDKPALSRRLAAPSAGGGGGPGPRSYNPQDPSATSTLEMPRVAVMLDEEEARESLEKLPSPIVDAQDIDETQLADKKELRDALSLGEVPSSTYPAPKPTTIQSGIASITNPEATYLVEQTVSSGLTTGQENMEVLVSRSLLRRQTADRKVEDINPDLALDQASREIVQRGKDFARIQYMLEYGGDRQEIVSQINTLNAHLAVLTRSQESIATLDSLAQYLGTVDVDIQNLNVISRRRLLALSRRAYEHIIKSIDDRRAAAYFASGLWLKNAALPYTADDRSGEVEVYNDLAQSGKQVLVLLRNSRADDDYIRSIELLVAEMQQDAVDEGELMTAPGRPAEGVRAAPD